MRPDQNQSSLQRGGDLTQFLLRQRAEALGDFPGFLFGHVPSPPQNGADLMFPASGPTTGRNRNAPSRANGARTWAGLYPNVVEFEAASPFANFAQSTAPGLDNNGSFKLFLRFICPALTIACSHGQNPSDP